MSTRPPIASHSPATWVIMALLLLRTALFTLADGSFYAADPHGWQRLLVYNNVVIVAVDVLTVGVIVVAMRRAGRSLREIVGPVRWVDLAWGVLAFVIITVAFFASSFTANLIVYHGPPPVPSARPWTPALWFGLWCVTIMPITIAVAEELLYRGFGQTLLAERWGRVGAWLVVALCFGLQHVPLSPQDPSAMAARFLTTFLSGLVFGALMWWFKRLAPLVVAHWLLDAAFLGLPILLIALRG